MDRQERIEQCKNDIAKLQENLRELEKPETPIGFGDVVICKHGKRVVLYNQCGNLVMFNKHSEQVGCIVPENNYYKRTGDNIFYLPNNLDN